VSKVRREHVAVKGERGREQYLRNTVRRQLESTADDNESQVQFDSTEAEPSEDELRATAISNRQPKNAVALYMFAHWQSIVITVFIAAFGWLFQQLYTLNRDVGRLEVLLQEVRSSEAAQDKRTDRVESQQREDVNKLEDRIDRIGAQQQPPAPTSRRQ
jgi:hypothetical protein